MTADSAVVESTEHALLQVGEPPSHSLLRKYSRPSCMVKRNLGSGQRDRSWMIFWA